MPYKTSLGDVYDCGDFIRNFDECLAVGDYGNGETRREDARARGRILGIGTSNTITGVATTNFEHVEVRFDTSGAITLLCGAMDHGQGHGTTFKQVLADKLGIDGDRIRYRYGDTDKVTTGVGTFNARSAVFAGSAVAIAADKIIDKGKRIAAHLLEAAEEDIEFSNGTFSVKGSRDEGKTIQDIALAANTAWSMPEGVDPGLEASAFFNPSNFVYPFGTHLAEVEIDRETGEIEFQRYLAVDDCGNIINPMIVEGQVQGGVAQGAAQALWEGAVYDDDGNLVTGSMMSYAIPKAEFLPNFELGKTETPTNVNPLGVKGVGETGTIASTPTVYNAVMDALAPLGVQQVDMPLTPERVWTAIQDAQKGGK